MVSLGHIQTEANVKNGKEYNDAHEKVIEWYAAEKLLYWDIDQQRVVKRPTITILAQELGVSRQTIYNWRKSIPNVSQRIKNARKGLLVQNVTAVWNTVFLDACRGDSKAIEMYLTNFDPDFISPRRNKSRNPTDNNPSLTGLLQEARKSKRA